MKINLKLLVFLETALIIILIFITAGYIHKEMPIQTSPQGKNSFGFLSPRVYAGLIQPKSFLIINFNPLQEKLKEYIRKKNITASVYVLNLRDGASMGINEEDNFYPASLNKLPIAILIMKKIEDGELSMDTMIPINDSDRSSTWGTLYKTKEKALPVRVLLEKMLKESDNTAFLILQRQVDNEDLNIILNYLNYFDINPYVHRTENDDSIDTKSMANIFSSLYLSTVLERNDSEYILSLLTKSDFDINKIAKLPSDVRVAQKFGENYYGGNKFLHDCGIMYFNESRIFYCVMTKGLEENEARETIGIFINAIYNYVTRARKTFDTYRAYKE